MTHAADMGVTFWDTADVYGFGHNEGKQPYTVGMRLMIELVGKWFQKTGRRKEIFICTKIGFRLDSSTGGICGTPAYIKNAGEESLRRLQVEQIDMLFLHRFLSIHLATDYRADRDIPIEHTVGAMVELVKEGKVL
jgi:aryl-alcohol dehydrogenase-like predicted oxidoreductase